MTPNPPITKPIPRLNPIKERALQLAVESTARWRNSSGSTIEIARQFEKYLTEKSE